MSDSKKINLSWAIEDLKKVIHCRTLLGDEHVKQVEDAIYILEQHELANGQLETTKTALPIQSVRCRSFELDFNGHLKAEIQIRDGEYRVMRAVDGYGDKVDAEKCTFSSLTDI